MIDFDAAVIGYGPVGATLANLLGMGGLAVVVIEKDTSIFDKPRAIGIDHESLRTLQFCGLGKEVSGLIAPYRGASYLGVDGQPIRELVAGKPPYLLGWPPNASFIQPELEACMRRGAESHPNVKVMLGAELDGIARRPGSARINLGIAGERELTAKYVMACDGANSFVRRSLGTTFEDLNFDEWWVVVDAWLKNPDAVPATSRQYCWPSRPGTYVVGPRNLRRWEFKLLPGEQPGDYSDQASILRVLRTYVDVDAIDLWRTAAYRFHAIVANSWQDGNIFLLGDAAHQTPPFLGQGMNSGIRDAANIAWKLLMVEKCDAKPSLLETYEAERRPHFRSVVEHSKQQGLIVGELDVEKARQRDARLRDMALRGELSTSRQSYIPALTAGLIGRNDDGRPRPLAGTLFPQPVIRTQTGKEGLLDDLFGMGFLLVIASEDFADWLCDAELRALAEMNAAILVLCDLDDAPALSPDFCVATDISGVLNDWWKDKDAAAILVRPDRYIVDAARSAAELRTQIKSLYDACIGSG